MRKGSLAVVVLAASLAACADTPAPKQGGDGSGGTGGTGGGQGGAGGGTGGAGGGEGGTGGGAPAGWISAPVEVTLDAHGIPYVSAKTDEDAIAALGYLHAQSRFFQMDLFRRVGRGRVASLISLQLSADEFLRPYFSRASDGAPLEELVYPMLNAEEQAHLQAYARGVNQWLADVRANRNGAELSDEYKNPLLPQDATLIPDWTPEDSIAFARYMTFDLSDASGDGLSYSTLFAALDPAIAPDLLTLRPGMEAFTMPASGVPYPSTARPDLAAIRAIQAQLNDGRRALLEAERRRDAVSFLLLGGPAVAWEKGSNNWVVGPTKSATGNALLANDPHLGLGNPAIWYFAVLDAKTNGTGRIHAGGATFPAGPLVPIGRNEDVSWGATVVGWDVTDDYIETLNEAGTAVMFNGAEVPLVTRAHTFEVFGQGGAERTLEWVPHHGPLLSKDVAGRRAVSARWTGQEPTLEVRALRNLMLAGSVSEARTALLDFSTGAQNWVLADRTGAIGWFPHAKVPLRPWAANAAGKAPWMALPGDGTAEWQGYMASDDLPQMFDPPQAFIATANQDHTGSNADGDPSNDGHNLLQSDPDIGFREGRILELLTARDDHDVASMVEIASDTLSIPARLFVPHLLAAADANPAGLTADSTAIVASLRGWDFTCPTGLSGADPTDAAVADPAELAASRGCLAFHVSLTALYKAAFRDELRAASSDVGRGSAGVQRLTRTLVLLLENPAFAVSGEALWDDVSTAGVTETKDDCILKAMDDAGGTLTARVGGVELWQWGRLHTITFESQLASLDATLNDGPYANDGGLFTVDVANIGADGANYTHTAGPSLRIVNEMKPDGIVTNFQYAGGQDGHRDGDFYGTLIPNWLQNTPAPLSFTATDAAANRVTGFTLSP